MNVEKLCFAGLIAGAIGTIFSLFECSQGGPGIAGAAGLCASAFVIGSSLLALAIAQRREK